MPIGIAEVDRMRDAVIFEVKSNSALLQFFLRLREILPIGSQSKM